MRVHKPDGRVVVLYVDELGVLSPHRRKGVATVLLNEVTRIAEEIGAWRVRLTVDPSNEPARELYKSVGMEERPLVLCQKLV